MSREFGEFNCGYFHHKIDNSTDDLRYAKFELHKKLVPFFESLYKVAYQISSVEAADSGEQASIDALREQIPVMIEELQKYKGKLIVTLKIAFIKITKRIGIYETK